MSIKSVFYVQKTFNLTVANLSDIILSLLAVHTMRQGNVDAFWHMRVACLGHHHHMGESSLGTGMIKCLITCCLKLCIRCAVFFGKPSHGVTLIDEGIDKDKKYGKTV